MRRGEGGSRTVTVPTHMKEVKRGTLRSLRRQAGWSTEQFSALIEKYR